MRLLWAWAVWVDPPGIPPPPPQPGSCHPFETQWRPLVTVVGIRRHKAHWVGFLLEVFSEHFGSPSVLSPNSVHREAGQDRGGEHGFWGQLPAFESLPLTGRCLLSPLYKVGIITVPISWGCYEDERSLCAKSLELCLAHKRCYVWVSYY